VFWLDFWLSFYPTMTRGQGQESYISTSNLVFLREMFKGQISPFTIIK